MVEKFTISELSDKLGISTTAIYKKVEKQQLKTIKEKVGSREITFILLEDNQIENLINETNQNKLGFKTVKEGYKTIENQSDIALKVIELTEKLSNQFETYSKQLVEYAEQAGQVKLLTDNLSQEKKDSEFYKEEYFKLKYENEKLTNLNNDLSSNNQDTEKSKSELSQEITILKQQNQEFAAKCQHLQLELDNLKNQQQEQPQQQKKSGFMGLFRK